MKKQKKATQVLAPVEAQLDRAMQRAFEAGVREGRRLERDRLRGRILAALGGRQ